MRESQFQRELMEDLRDLFPDCILIKNDPNYIQGIPDLLILNYDKWAALEVKASSAARRQPNQTYYVDLMNEMAFAAFVYPENKEAVLHELQRALRPSR